MKNERERLLMVVIGGVTLLIVGFFVVSWVSGQFSRRRGDIARLKDDIKKFDRQVALGRAASRKIKQFEERSLPADAEKAKTQYVSWLVNEMERAGLIEPDVRAGASIGGEKDLFIKQPFTVDASGTLPQIVELLYQFYREDWLHRITDLKLSPVKDSKLLNLKLHIETLSLKKASSVDKLKPRISHRLKYPDAAEYYDSIVGRNLFGPRNQEPKIAVTGSLDVFVRRPAELLIKGEDPDPLDQVYVNLVESSAPDAKVDPATGKFTWTPQEPGKYEFVVEGVDDGFPTKPSERKKFVLNVREQAEAPAAAQFDVSKFTVLTALLDVDGRGEVWLHVRPTNQMVTLHQGDQFEIGSVKGTVSQINEFDFCFDFEGKRRKLGQGEMLDQSKVIGDVPQVASPAKPPTPEVEVQAKTDDKAS
jgi:hypothetical protein